MSLIYFIHTADYPKKHLSERYNKTDVYYWLSDRYFDQLTFGKYSGYKYVYFYIKDEDKIDFTYKYEGGSLKEAYLKFTRWGKDRENGIKAKSFYEQPPILISQSEIAPNLIAEYDKVTKDFLVVYPRKYKNTKLNLFNKNGYARNFLDTKLPTVFPKILSCYSSGFSNAAKHNIA